MNKERRKQDRPAQEQKQRPGESPLFQRLHDEDTQSSDAGEESSGLSFGPLIGEDEGEGKSSLFGRAARPQRPARRDPPPPPTRRDPPPPSGRHDPPPPPPSPGPPPPPARQRKSLFPRRLNADDDRPFDLSVSYDPAIFLGEEQAPQRDDPEAEIHRAESRRLFAQPYRHAGRGRSGRARPPGGPFSFNTPLQLVNDHPLLAMFISILLIILLFPWPGNPVPSAWRPLGEAVSQVAESLGLVAPPPNPPGDYRLRAPPSLNAAQVDAILESYGSPATGTGAAWVELGRQYNIDPAFAVAFFVHESTAGTNPNWAGIKPDGTTTHNVGNIICAGYPRCFGRFRDYGSWEEGIADWYRLIDREYLDGRGHETVADIIPVYAPAIENDVNAYVTSVERLVDRWRAANQQNISASDEPTGNPLNDARTVITQGYGVGSHAPARTWGAIDLALDGDGDGAADPDGSWNRPIYATHSGVVAVTANSYPAGNHVWVVNHAYRTGYAHLSSFAVADGQTVARGTLIGYMGSTGQSSGPHLDYQVWRRAGATWVNVNPLDYRVLEPLR